MMVKMGSVHEPEAALLSAEDAIQDAERLRALFHRQRPEERVVPLRVPFWALLEAIDYLEPNELYQAVQRAQRRLAAIGA
jgi:hypothetical protein